MAGQWLEIVFDGVTGGQREVQETVTGLTPGGLACLVGQIEVVDTSGYVASNAAGNSLCQLTLWNAGKTVMYARSIDFYFVGTSPGPVFAWFTVPAGVTSAVIHFQATAATGVAAKFHLGACDVIDLTTLGAVDMLA